MNNTENSSLRIRKATLADQDAIWQIIQQVISTGDTYVFSPNSTRASMMEFWCGADRHTYVATVDQEVVGTFVIKDNFPGLGAHVANAAYMTAPNATGKGIGTKMGQQSLMLARELGYYAMQFNIVVKSNERAVRLWQKLGFQIIGEVPDAFMHQQLGLTNIYIMWQKL